MKFPNRLLLFTADKLASARMKVEANGVKWVVFATRGLRFVLLRAYVEQRPWQCLRYADLTVWWDQRRYAEREDIVMGFLRKLTRPQQGHLAKPDGCDSELVKKFPAFHEWLTRQVDDEGKPRQTASFTVYGVPGGFRAFLNDRDTGASLSAESDSFKGLLAALEGELESDAPHWFWRQQQQGQGGKKKGKGD